MLSHGNYAKCYFVLSANSYDINDYNTKMHAPSSKCKSCILKIRNCIDPTVDGVAAVVKSVQCYLYKTEYNSNLYAVKITIALPFQWFILEV